MAAIFSILAGLAGLGILICWIMVLIKMFNSAGAVQGIIGIFCGIWAFIWGWMNAAKEGLKNVMMAWTALFILVIILEILIFVAASH